MIGNVQWTEIAGPVQIDPHKEITSCQGASKIANFLTALMPRRSGFPYEKQQLPFQGFAWWTFDLFPKVAPPLHYTGERIPVSLIASGKNVPLRCGRGSSPQPRRLPCPLAMTPKGKIVGNFAVSRYTSHSPAGSSRRRNRIKSGPIYPVLQYMRGTRCSRKSRTRQSPNG